jgi:hypothetical protein
MSYQQTTRQGIDPVRATRVVVGLLIATLGLYVVASQAAPVLWAAIRHIAATPAKLQAVEFSAIAGAATGLGGMGPCW